MDALEEDVFNILLATDIHLGYGEKDPIKGEDSFNTFEEILITAVNKEVDFILLGGDLFHENKPSIACMHKAMTLIKKYCLGDKPVSVSFLSDQSENFKHCKNPIVNYEDPNLNISIPIFSIHGNHDDPSGFGRTCSLDLLSATGLVNYFGRVDDLSTIKISPLLLKKGISQLAIYGLSYVKDDRLTRLFRDKKVHMYSVNGGAEDWFNIFVCHQNRADRGPGKCLSENVLPKFLDLVFWGHEHDCRVEEEYNASREFYVTQPGSPVATSLCIGEAIPKHIALLKVYKKNFKLEPIKLQTVRPFVFDSIILSQCDLPDDGETPSDNVMTYVSNHLETMFDEVGKLLTGHPKQPTQPLMRLRVDYESEDQMFNAIRFGHALGDRVANPSDVILLRREPKYKVKSESPLDQEALDEVIDMQEVQASIWDMKVEQVIEAYFNQAENEQHRLQLLSVKGMCEAVMQYVTKDEKDAVEEVTKSQVDKTMSYLLDHGLNDDNGLDLIRQFRELRELNPNQEVDEVKALFTSSRPKTSNNPVIINDSDDDDFGGPMTRPTPARGRGRGRGRGSRAANQDDSDYGGGLPKPKGRSKTVNQDIVISDDDDDYRGGASTSSGGSSRARGRGTAARAAPTRARGRARGAASNGQLTLQQSFMGTQSQRRQASTRNKGISFQNSDSD